MRKIETYRDLDICDGGIELVKCMYKLTGSFPKRQMYRLVSQMARSAISIPSNVAEGLRRYQDRPDGQFPYVSFGSCAESETQLTIAKELQYIKEAEEVELLEELDHILSNGLKPNL